MGKLETIRDKCDIDLADPTYQFLEGLQINPVLLVRVLWWLVEEQAEAAGVDGKAFGEAFDGDTFEDALKALEVAVINFTPRTMRPVLQKLTTLNRDTIQTKVAAAIKATEDPDFLAKVEKAEEAKVRRGLQSVLQQLERDGIGAD